MILGMIKGGDGELGMALGLVPEIVPGTHPVMVIDHVQGLFRTDHQVYAVPVQNAARCSGGTHRVTWTFCATW